MNTLNKLATLEKEATDFGFKWQTSQQIMAQIRSELSEIDVHLKDQDQNKLQDEIGDLLHAAFSLCVFHQFEPQITLENSMNKFERRFNAVKQLAHEQGFNTLHGQSFSTLMELWDKAKVMTG